MIQYWLKPFRAALPVSMALAMVLAVACGAAATATPEDTNGDTEPTATPGESPTAMPQETSEPSGSEPSGTLEIGFAEFGKFEGHPQLTSSPRISITNLAVGEGAFMIDQDLQAQPMLVESWEVSDDGLTWTFNMQPGVEFHKGFGELTAEDFVYSQNQWAEGALHARAAFMEDFWNHPDGSVTYPDGPDGLTVEVNTGEPWVQGRVWEWMANLGGASSWIVSKAQSDEVGVQEASENISATGPWEIVEHSTAEFWRMEAVEDHWRKTPHFQELVFRQLPEESSRVAGFQTGELDSFQMAFDSIPVVEETEGARLMSVPNAGQMGLNMYGQLYMEDPETGEVKGTYNPDNAWVSSNPDVNSQEWENARKVREAMAIAVDRQTLVDTLLRGYAQPLVLRDWAGHESRMNPEWQFEYDPDRARQLLEEAGYGDGFSITLTPAIRNAPAEVEVCDAVAQMWGNVGIDVDINRIPYSTLRPTLISRNYNGATCHAVSIRLVVAIGASNYLNSSVFSYGTHHPDLNELVKTANSTVDPEEQKAAERAVYDFMYENVMAFGLYSYDAVWPVGKDIQEWEPTSFGDLRNMNGFENIRPRQQ